MNWLRQPATQTQITHGARLWLYYAHGAEMSGGWFCHGRLA